MFLKDFLKNIGIGKMFCVFALSGSMALAADKNFLSVSYSPMVGTIESTIYNGSRSKHERDRDNGGDFSLTVGNVYNDISRFYIEGGFSQKYRTQNTRARLGYIALGADWTPKISRSVSSSVHFILGGSVGIGLADFYNEEFATTSPNGNLYNTYKGKTLGIHTTARTGVLFTMRQLQLEAGVKAMFGSYASKAKVNAVTTVPSPYDNFRIISEQIGPYVSVGFTF